MPETKILLEQLGVGETNNPTQFAEFIKCKNHDEHTGIAHTGINVELTQMVEVKQRLEKEIYQLIKEGKILYHGPLPLKFTYKWNAAHNFLEILHDEPPIRGVVTFSRSNNTPGVTDFTGRVDSVQDTAADMIEAADKSGKFDRAAFIAANQELTQNTRAFIEEQFKIAGDQSKGAANKRFQKQRETAFENIKYALRDYVTYMAIEIIRAEKGAKHVPTVREVKEVI